MLTYFPKYCSSRAIICYFITLLTVSVFFFERALPFQFMLFGIIPVCLFFAYSNRLTMDWRRYTVKNFTKKLFVTALLIRIACVIFLYFYFIEATGLPHVYYPGDSLFYAAMGKLWHDIGFEETVKELREYVDLSDRGYCWWLSFEGLLLGPYVFPSRIVKCFIDAFSCVLIYNIAKRNFGEWVGRMSAIFCMLMPNMWYYCGVTLKETEMAFLVILFTERVDMVLHSTKIKVVNLLVPGLCILAMFTFRTALASVMIASLAAGLILSTSKKLQTWQKVVYSIIFAVWMFGTVGVEILEEVQTLWEGRTENQLAGYEWRTETNSFARYATSSVFAPLIFTIPFSSLVNVFGQENQIMMNGANFIKNIMSGFVIVALLSMLFDGSWRKHVLPIALTCGYLAVLVFSTFAHSERFHFPILSLELMFAAYGVSLMKNRHKKWFEIWLVIICVANFVWSWIKLAGRGLV